MHNPTLITIPAHEIRAQDRIANMSVHSARRLNNIRQIAIQIAGPFGSQMLLDPEQPVTVERWKA